MHKLTDEHRHEVIEFGRHVENLATHLFVQLNDNLGSDGERHLFCSIAKQLIETSAKWLASCIDNRGCIDEITDGVGDQAYNVMAAGLGDRLTDVLQVEMEDDSE